MHDFDSETEYDDGLDSFYDYDHGDFDDDDDLPVLPSPTRARSANGNRSANEDPFKNLANAARPLAKPVSRLGSTPSLEPLRKPRPVSAVPIIATSPSRPRTPTGATSRPSRH